MVNIKAIILIIKVNLVYLSKVIFLYNFRCRTRIAGGFMIHDYVTNQSKNNNKKNPHSSAGLFGGPPGVRTLDTLIKSQVLCQLS